MKVNLVFASAEGRERAHDLIFDLPAVPGRGDHLTITRPGQAGTTDLVVRRVYWALDHPDESHRADRPVAGTLAAVTVECDLALGSYAQEEHRDPTAALAK